MLITRQQLFEMYFVFLIETIFKDYYPQYKHFRNLETIGTHLTLQLLISIHQHFQKVRSA